MASVRLLRNKYLKKYQFKLHVRLLSHVNPIYEKPARKINPDGYTSTSYNIKPYINSDQIDIERLRDYRLNRVRNELSKRGIGAALFFDPVNIRYAVDARNMSIFTMRFLSRYCFGPVNGPVILYDFFGCDHLSQDIQQIDEIRTAVDCEYSTAVSLKQDNVRKFSKEILDLVNKYCDGDNKLAIDICERTALSALENLGLDLQDGKEIAERAKLIKSPEEVLCMRASIEVANQGVKLMRENLRAGITEEQLWAHLHKTNIENGGEWIETRLLTSGVRTNPWLSECSNKIIESGDILAFDTDMVGPYGYCCDMSRTFVEGDVFTSEQKRIYEIAVSQIEHNVALIKPGLHFKEFTEKAFQLPENCMENRYPNMCHGVGLTDEFPFVAYPCDGGHVNDHFEENMTICVESYIGEHGGKEGVKLEQQYLINENGMELLTLRNILRNISFSSFCCVK